MTSPSPTTNTHAWKGLVVALMFAAAGLFTYFGTRDLNRTVADRRDFQLQDTAGRLATLDTYKGKWVLMFFGFTSCPDICPNALLNVVHTLEAMGAAARNIQPVFITIDPERDSAQVLKDYLANFGDNIAGLTGTPEQIAAVTNRYQASFRKRPTDDGSYTMDHSTAFELISPDGIYIRAFRPDDDPKQFAKALLATMGEAKQ